MTRRLLRRRGGFVLVATLWITMAITTVLFAFAAETRLMRSGVTAATDAAHASANAEAGMETTLSRLGALARGIRPAGAPAAFDVRDPWHGASALATAWTDGNGAGYEVNVRDIASTLDINIIGPLQWRAFLAALGVDDVAADRLTAAIGDWRDLDDTPRSSGAERDAYLAMGRLHLPANRDFASIDALRSVAGMTPEILRAAKPYLGVASSGRVNVNTAPPPVLRALPQFTDDVMQVVLAERVAGRRFTSLPDLLAKLPPASRSRMFGEMATFAGVLTFETKAVEVTSVGWGPGHRARAVAVAEVVLAGSQLRIDWRYMQ
jgi:general secretion pathway protein K